MHAHPENHSRESAGRAWHRPAAPASRRGRVRAAHGSHSAFPVWRHIPKPRHNFRARHLLAQHDRSSCIEANQVQCIPAGIDTNGDDGGLDFGMAWCSFCCPTQACSLAGREHGRSIPFWDIGPSRRHYTSSARSRTDCGIAKVECLCGAEIDNQLFGRLLSGARRALHRGIIYRRTPPSPQETAVLTP
jgi:hypothetical protein